MSKKSKKVVDDVEVGNTNMKGSTAPVGSEKGKNHKSKKSITSLKKTKITSKGGHMMKTGIGWKGK